MPMYEVLRDCASGVTEQLHKGDHVDLDKDVADWLNGQMEEGPAVKPISAKSEPKEQ
jgi:hypothetical protein